MNLQPTLDNELVRIRPLSLLDYDMLFQVASDKEIWGQHTTTDRWQPDGFVTFFDDAMRSKGTVVIIDKVTDNIIGASRYHIEDGFTSAIEIGWSFLAKKYWGGQYNRSFKSLMIDHALVSKEDVLFLIAMDNLRSQRAIEKLGAERLLKRDNPQYFRREKTHYTYRITQTIWDQRARDHRF